jgi:hypothetical protein
VPRAFVVECKPASGVTEGAQPAGMRVPA